MCGHSKDVHASGPGYSFTYCKAVSGCDCEGYEKAEDMPDEIDFDEED